MATPAMPVPETSPPQGGGTLPQQQPMPTSQQGQPAAPDPATKVKAAAQKATRVLTSAATSLPQVVQQSAQQQKQQESLRMKQTLQTVAQAHLASTAAQDKAQKINTVIQQIDQHMKDAQALPEDDPTRLGRIGFFAHLHQQAVQELSKTVGDAQQHQQVVQALMADPKNRKIIEKAVGYDEKQANSPERQMLVSFLQQQGEAIQTGAQKAMQQAQQGQGGNPSQPPPDGQSGGGQTMPVSGQPPPSGGPPAQAGGGHGHLGAILQFLGTRLLSPKTMSQIPGSAENKQALQQKALALQEQVTKMQDTQSQIDQREAAAGMDKARAASLEPWQEKQKDEAAKLKVQQERVDLLSKKAASPSAFKGKSGVLFDESVPYGWTDPASGKQYAAGDPEMPEAGQSMLAAAKAAYDRYQKLKADGSKGANLRAEAYWGNYLMHAEGVDMKGKPLPGMMQTDTGETVGTSGATNVRPTGTERQRADLAGSSKEQMNDMIAILRKAPKEFGPGAGQFTSLTAWLGSQDPDAQRFKSAAVTTAGHLAGVFGGTSDAKLKDIYDVIGKYKTNPEAAIAGIEQMMKAATQIQTKGTVHTTGSSSSLKAIPPGAPTATGPKGEKLYWDGKAWQPAQ